MNACQLRLSLCLSLLLTLGCQTGAPRLATDVSPTELADADGAMLIIPADEPFTIVEQNDQRSASAGGAATAESSVDPAGSASVSVDVSDGGEADASFQLGHAVKNAFDRQAKLALTVSFDGDFTLVAPADQRFPDATLTLNLVMHNRRTRASRVVPLVQRTTEHGGIRETGRRTFAADMLVSPPDVIDVYLAGQVRAAARDDREFKAELALENVRFEIVATPAKSQQSDDDD